jgi:hypothetical protein
MGGFALDRFSLRQKFAASIALVLASACSSTKVAQAPAPISEPQRIPVLALPHPEGYASADLDALLKLPEAPQAPESCHVTQRELAKRVLNAQELERGVAELVVDQPAVQHWCFYHRFRHLDSELKELEGILKKQQHVIETYRDVLPIARAFQSEFKDSRYLRWAIQTYRRVSPQVFFRTVELTPEATQELVLIERPFSDWKAPASGLSVLEKYGLKEIEGREPASAATAPPAVIETPAPTATPAPSPSSSSEFPLMEPGTSPVPSDSPISVPSPSPSPSPAPSTSSPSPTPTN